MTTVCHISQTKYGDFSLSFFLYKAQNNFVEITPQKAMNVECAELTPDSRVI